MRLAFALVASALCACAPRPMVVSPRHLVSAAPYPSAAEARRATETNSPVPTGSVMIVEEGGGSQNMPRSFDLLIMPTHGPARRFMRPVSARLEDDVLLVSGSNHRAESRIRVADVASITMFRSRLPDS